MAGAAGRWRTCAKEEHLVVAVGGRHLVHRHRGVLVVGVGPDHQGASPHRVDGVEHDGVVPHEGHHVVRELLGGLDVRGEGSAGTLGEGIGVGVGVGLHGNRK